MYKTHLKCNELNTSNSQFTIHGLAHKCDTLSVINTQNGRIVRLKLAKTSKWAGAS